eukprot:CAMPEP_0119035490 /NCGR_PEP_ID=MMETSP1177-20130426/2548_1 /TAXON_ID=2985 /ORGANISM="Ochromonas sp, Strain CCMP1899" /LENGTH=280 /DNA_ID=CAMNT_0006993851 /DNA_START=156 /DNA_END=995 /DNA_ORIENTATION=+
MRMLHSRYITDLTEMYGPLSLQNRQELEVRLFNLDEEEDDEGNVIRDDLIIVPSAQELGADVESLMCISCELVVEEFGRAVAVKAMSPKTDGKNRFIEDIYDMGTFCHKNNFSMLYSDFVIEVCRHFTEDNMHETLINAFQSEIETYGIINDNEAKIRDVSWSERINSQKLLDRKKREVCAAVGGCKNNHIRRSNFTGSMDTGKNDRRREEHWTQECHVCQAVVADLEMHLQLTKYIANEEYVSQLTSRTCDRLEFTSIFDTMCRTLISDIMQSADEFSW